MVAGHRYTCRLTELPSELLDCVRHRLNAKDRIVFGIALCDRRAPPQDDSKLVAMWKALVMRRNLTSDMVSLATRRALQNDITLKEIILDIGSTSPNGVALTNIARVSHSMQPVTSYKISDSITAYRMSSCLQNGGLPDEGWPGVDDEVGSMTANRVYALASPAAMDRLMTTSAGFRKRFTDSDQAYSVAFFVAANHGNLPLMRHLIKNPIYGMDVAQCVVYLKPDKYTISIRPLTRVAAWTILREHAPHELVEVKARLLEILDIDGVRELRNRFGI